MAAAYALRKRFYLPDFMHGRDHVETEARSGRAIVTNNLGLPVASARSGAYVATAQAGEPRFRWKI